MSRLPQRLRKLIGTVILLAGLTLYVFLVVTIAVGGHVPGGGAWQFAYFLIAGVLWALPAAFLITWMQRPDAER